MSVTFRHYQPVTDYQPVSDFLIANHQSGNLDGNWLEPAWEYMHFHPALRPEHLAKNGIWEEDGRPLYRFDIPDPFPAIALVDGFRLTSLAEECDWVKVHQVLWRGFGHGDDVPMTEDEFEDPRKMFDTPKARRDLKIAVAAPNGEFAAFCGMFFSVANDLFTDFS